MPEEDDDELVTCTRCEEVYNINDMDFDEEWVCSECKDADEADHQMQQDYYSWAR